MSDLDLVTVRKKRKRPHYTFTLDPKVKLKFQDNCFLAGLDMSYTVNQMMTDFNKVYTNLQKAKTELKPKHNG